LTLLEMLLSSARWSLSDRLTIAKNPTPEERIERP
jgi:hypothetical protein